MINNGNGAFVQQAIIQLTYRVVAARIVDVNADSKCDLLLFGGGFDSQLEIYLNPGAVNQFELSSSIFLPGGPGSFDIGDLDGDLDDDLIIKVNEIGSEINVYLNDGAGIFSAGPVYSDEVGILKLADINGDQILDLLASTGEQGGSILAYRGNGNGTFESPNLFTAGFAAAIEVADFDGDADNDIASLNIGGRNASIPSQ